MCHQICTWVCLVLFVVVMLIVYGVLYWISDEDVFISAWWCYQMETFYALLTICGGNSPVTGEFPAQSPVMLSLICAWINGLINNREVGDLRRHRAHFDVTVMMFRIWLTLNSIIELVPMEPPGIPLVTWMGNHTPSKVWDEITYPFPHFTCHVISYSCWVKHYPC